MWALCSVHIILLSSRQPGPNVQCSASWGVQLKIRVCVNVKSDLTTLVSDSELRHSVSEADKTLGFATSSSAKESVISPLSFSLEKSKTFT